MKMDYTELFCEKYRPQTLDDVILEPKVREYFNSIMNVDEPVIPNLLLWGHPGGGKTTLAKIIRRRLGWDTLQLNASESSGIDAMRNTVMGFTSTVSLNGKMKLVILEEADGLSNNASGGVGSSAQELLKNLIESTSSRVRFILLVNNVNKINEAIRSRMQEVCIRPPNPDDEEKEILKLLGRVVIAEGIKVTDPFDLKRLANSCYPDIRKMLQMLQQMSSNENHEFKFAPVANTRMELLARDILKRLMGSGELTNTGLMKLREDIINSEKVFDADYLSLMRCMFNILAAVDIKATDIAEGKFQRKCAAMLVINDYMIKHTSVVDKEINMFCLLIELGRLNRVSK